VPIVTRVAAELSLHSTGVGRVLLAFAPNEFVEAVLAEGLTPHTPHTITDPGRLRACLAEVRRIGYAVTSEEMTLGSCSVAAPVRDAKGEVLAALSLVTRSNNADLRRLVPVVLAAARALSHDVITHGGSTEWKDLA
jgi:DNA-binding IclR family transcriptional regulator